MPDVLITCKSPKDFFLFNPCLRCLRTTFTLTANIWVPPRHGNEKQPCSLQSQAHKNCLSWPHKSYISMISKRPPIKSYKHVFGMRTNTIKSVHECIRGISCELALRIHKAVFTPKLFHSFKKQRERGLFEVSHFSFFSPSCSPSLSLSLSPGKRRLSQPNLLLVHLNVFCKELILAAW